MNKTTRVLLGISLQVILLGVIIIGMSFLTDHLQSTGFFGDRLKTKQDVDTVGEYVWGFRHVVYCIVCLVLSCLSIIRIATWAASEINK